MVFFLQDKTTRRLYPEEGITIPIVHISSGLNVTVIIPGSLECIEVKTNGDKFVGRFLQPVNFKRRNGIKILASNPGYLYEGEMVGDFKDGQGHLSNQGVLVYSGCFKNDQMHGKGRQYEGNREYIGTWKNGAKSGCFFEREETEEGQNVYVSYYEEGKLLNKENTDDFIPLGATSIGNQLTYQTTGPEGEIS